MKELSIEEKVKRYDEVLAMAKECLKDGTITSTATGYIETIFPELKESEDERIRKWLINEIKINHHNLDEDSVDFVDKAIAWLEKQGEMHLENYDKAEKEKADFVGDGFIECHANFLDFKEGNTYWLEYIGDDKYNVRSDNLLGKTYHITPCQLYTIFKKQTWLEKQGEQKPNKVEPRFKNGQWVVWQDKCYKVNYNGCRYELVDQNGLSTSLEYGTIDENAHLWDIAKDAKDGDVLATEDWVFIFKKINSKREPTCYCHYDIELGFFIDTNSYIATGSEIYPATKEQRDTLIKAMADARYTFDFEKKELNKIEHKHAAWSEWDKNFMYNTLSNLTELKDRFGEEYGNVGKCIKWLKSLKDRVQLKPDWSEEDEIFVELKDED